MNPRKNKTPAVAKALKALENFLKENNLDPIKDWSKDPKYGKQYIKLIDKLNLERDKLTLIYPTRDLKNEVKLTKLKVMKKEKKAAEKEAAKKEKKLIKKELPKKEEKEKKGRKVATKYNYPLIDGREMTSDEKKKYRMEQRKLAAGKNPKEKKEEMVEKKLKKEEGKVEKKKSSKVKKEKKPKKDED